MALKDMPENLEEYLKLVPAVKHSPKRYLWSSYDEEGDVLYIHFQSVRSCYGQRNYGRIRSRGSTRIILRYDGEEVVANHHSTRQPTGEGSLDLTHRPHQYHVAALRAVPDKFGLGDCFNELVARYYWPASH